MKNPIFSFDFSIVLPGYPSTQKNGRVLGILGGILGDLKYLIKCMSPTMPTSIAVNLKRILTNFQSFIHIVKKSIMLSIDLGACLSIGSFKGLRGS